MKDSTQKADHAGINLNGLNPFVQQRFKPFLEDIIGRLKQQIHSVHIVGSAVTDDFNEKTSDINSIVVLNEMKMNLLKPIAPLGGVYRKKGISSPLFMTPHYISRSLDTFPVEFLNFKIMHRTVFGEDILNDISICPEYLRIQCEREIKVRLIGLRQGYVSSTGKDDLLRDLLIRFITGIIPLFRAILFLLKNDPPLLRKDALRKTSEVFGIDAGPFEKLLLLKSEVIKPYGNELHDIFIRVYEETEKLEKAMDELSV